YYIGATQGEIEAAVETVKAEAQRDVELIHSFETKNPEGVKDVLHRRFGRKRQKENWFGLGQKDVSWLKSRGGDPR
ncbi:MAG: hypothetical protein HY866_23620, partial [Chloroflexi bacterium]|nr:hypothetical protein [Chloroflexota bacterium]